MPVPKHRRQMPMWSSARVSSMVSAAKVAQDGLSFATCADRTMAEMVGEGTSALGRSARLKPS
jgi:hypothetical protein